MPSLQGDSTVNVHAGSNVSLLGAFTANNSVLNLHAGSFTGNNFAHNSRVTLAEDVTGSLRLLGKTNSSVKGTIGSGMNLVVDAASDGEFIGSIDGTLVNKGTLDFTDSGPNGQRTHLDGGTLENQGTLNFLQGSGGTRFLRSTNFTNKGILKATGTGGFAGSTVDFLSGSTLTGPGSVDFQGSTVNVHAGSSIFDLGGFSAGRSTVNVHAGSNVSVLGGFSANNSVLNLHAGSFTGNNTAFRSQVTLAEDVTGSLRLLGASSNSVKGTIGSGMNLSIDGVLDRRFVGRIDGILVNKGTLDFTNSGSVAQTTLLSFGTLDNQGTLNFLQGTGERRFLGSMTWNNSGNVGVEGSALLEAVTLNNTGNFAGVGSVLAERSDLNFLGGHIGAGFDAYRSQVNLAEDVMGSLWLLGNTNNSVKGTIGSGMNLVVDAALDGQFIGSIDGTLVNKGTLDFTNSRPFAQVTYLDNGTLDNQGTLNFLHGSGGTRHLRSMTWNNSGNVEVEGRAQLEGVTLSNTGSFSGVGSAFASGSTLNLLGGHIGARFDAYRSQVNLAEDVTGSLRLLGSEHNRVKGTIGTGMNLVVDAALEEQFHGVIDGSLVNKGTLDFTSSFRGVRSTHLNSGTLDNKGTLTFRQGRGGTRFLSNMTFTNKGEFFVQGSGRLDNTILTNTGTMHVDGVLRSNVQIDNQGALKGNGTVDARVIHSGILAPGASIGSLAVSTLEATDEAIFQFEIGDDIADRLDVLTSAVLNGTLSIIELPEFNGSIGDTFRIIDAQGGFLSGDFDVFSNSRWKYHYQSGHGGFVDATLVPEPGTLLALGLAALAALRRRRQKS